MNTAYSLDLTGMLQQLVTINTVINTKNQYMFTRQPNMQDRPDQDFILRYAEVFNSNQIAKDLNGQALLNEAAITSGYLVLKENNSETFQYFPLYCLNAAAYYSGRIRPINMRNVQWEQSYIQFPDLAALPGAVQTFLLSVFFEPIPKSNK